jgi:hypothetical protein
MNQTVYNVKRTITQESPSILTGLGVAGLISTTLLAVRATPIAMELVESEAYRNKCRVEELETIEAVKAGWKPYIPAVVVGGLTIACILGANSINLKRNAAIAGLYSVAVEGLREYQDKVLETVGPKKEGKIRDEIAQDRLDRKPVNDDLVIMASGDTLFFDSLTGRYFKSDMETIRRGVNDFNYELLTDMYKPLNDFYDFIGLEGTELGRAQGWNVDRGQLNINFSAKIINAEDSKWHNEPCIVMDYAVEPQYL